jgi:hypothetical protein
MIHARRRERYLKTSAGRRWLRSVLGDLRTSTLPVPRSAQFVLTDIDGSTFG